MKSVFLIVVEGLNMLKGGFVTVCDAGKGCGKGNLYLAGINGSNSCS